MEIHGGNLTLTRYESFLRIAEKEQEKSKPYQFSPKELRAFWDGYFADIEEAGREIRKMEAASAKWARTQFVGSVYPTSA